MGEPIINEYFPEEIEEEKDEEIDKKKDDASDSDKEELENTEDDGLEHALNENKKKKMKAKKLKKTDLRYIDVISCSAKSGKNIEKIFETCIKKTLPSKLSQSVTHSRTTTTAHVTAPIWLRNLVSDFDRSSSNFNR